VKTILEESRKVNVCRKADVVVVGGGPAGIGAAVAAARNGADTVLVERYGHLGGMATGGLVILIPHMSDGSNEQQIAGICQEWIDRLDVIGGAFHPSKEELGSSDPAVLEKWRHYFSVVVDGHIRQTAGVDPELLKCVLNDMIEEAGVKLYLHSWGCKAITKENKVQGVIFESKSGRQAIQAKITIDTTGDGDIFASAGAPYDGGSDGELRSAKLALVFRLGNCDFNKFAEFKDKDPGRWKDIMSKMENLGGYRFLPLFGTRDDVLWVNNWVPNRNCIDVEDLTWVEVNVRKNMLKVHDILKKETPGFEKSFILDTASQTGTRGSRRLQGEYTVTINDLRDGKTHDDTIALIPTMRTADHHITQIPYRSLVPKKIEGLLVAGRCYSSDTAANNLTNLIPHCVAMGQAAGTAAAIAIESGVKPRKVDTKLLKKKLMDQGVPLPA
jgi:hypothetical protein